MIGQGLTTAEIAERLHRSEKTVRSHRFAIGRKLNLRNRVELTHAAIRAGLVDVNQSNPQQNGERDDHWRRAMQAIEAGMNSTAGELFFPNLARQAATALGVQSVVISEICGRERDRLRSVAIYQCGRFEGSFDVPILGSACEATLMKGSCFRPSNVANEFPALNQLMVFDVDSYLGVALRDSVGQLIGTMCVMHDGPMPDEPQPDLVLRILGSRAAAELERLHLQARLDDLVGTGRGAAV